MKKFLFLLLLTATCCQSLPAQTVEKGYVIQMRTERVVLKGMGVTDVHFCEVRVGEKTKLLLLAGECPIEVGDCFQFVESHDVPPHIVFNGQQWYDYMMKFLDKR